MNKSIAFGLVTFCVAMTSSAIMYAADDWIAPFFVAFAGAIVSIAMMSINP